MEGQATIRFTLGTFGVGIGELNEQTRRAIIDIKQESSNYLLAHIQITAVKHLSLDIHVHAIKPGRGNSSVAYASVLKDHRLRVHRLVFDIDSSWTARCSLDFESIEVFETVGKAMPVCYSTIRNLLGWTQPLKIKTRGIHLQYDTLLRCNLRRLEMLDIDYPDSAAITSAVIGPCIASARMTLKTLRVVSSVYQWLRRCDDSFPSLTSLSITELDVHLDEVAVRFPNLKILELVDVRSIFIGRPSSTHIQCQIEELRLRLGNESLSRCADIRTLCPILTTVKVESCGRRMEGVAQLFEVNPWIPRVILTGKYCCPEKFGPLGFLRSMTGVEELSIVPEFKYSKLEWRNLAVATRELDRVRAFTLKNVSDVDFIRLNARGIIVEFA